MRYPSLQPLAPTSARARRPALGRARQQRAAAAVALALALTAACETARPRESPAECVEDREAGVVCSRIHPPGISEPTSPDFHGALLRSTAYDFTPCTECHGRSFTGGTSKVNCLGCHADGPTACTTCHEKLPQQGAHAKHLAGATVITPEACATCHVVPAQWDSAGHLRRRRGVLDPAPAEVVFGAAASAGAPADRLATFDPATRTCGNVTCHGGLIPDTGAADPRPRWDAPSQDLGCTRCHGFPPTTAYHAVDTCESCHPRVANRMGQLLDPSLHIDTRVDLGPDGTGACEGCHGGIGDDPMHAAHLRPTLRLGGAVACEGCHVVPSTPRAAGHLDSAPPVEVFPVGHSGVAWANTSTPTWDASARTCAGSWCHGKATTLLWQRFPSQLVCGTCHGVPPPDSDHLAEWSLRECARCHDSVDPYGNPIIVETSTGVTSRHLDGKVDLR